MIEEGFSVRELRERGGRRCRREATASRSSPPASASPLRTGTGRSTVVKEEDDVYRHNKTYQIKETLNDSLCKLVLARSPLLRF